MRFTYLLIILLSLVAGRGHAQGPAWGGSPGGKKNSIKNLSVEGGFGFRMYFGDIQQKGSLFNPIKLTYGIGARYQFLPAFGTTLQLEGRGYKGKAEHGGYPDAIDEMTGKLWGGQLLVHYSWLRWEDFTKRQFTERDPVKKINAYIGSGFGAAMFSSSYTSRKYRTVTGKDSLGNDSTYAFPVDASGSAAGVAPYVPIVLGFRYRFKPHFSVGFDIQRHIYVVKNIDAYSSKKYDGMGTLTLRASYTFGQPKPKGSATKVSRKGKWK
ncbi:MAG: hypothetical protein R2813_10355 [Flavobacteriales bacterium]